MFISQADKLLKALKLHFEQKESSENVSRSQMAIER